MGGAGQAILQKTAGVHRGEASGVPSDALERGRLLLDPEEAVVPPGRVSLGLTARLRLRLRLRLRVRRRRRRRRRNGQVWRASNREVQQEGEEEGAPPAGEEEAQGVPGLGLGLGLGFREPPEQPRPAGEPPAAAKANTVSPAAAKANTVSPAATSCFRSGGVHGCTAVRLYGTVRLAHRGGPS